MYIVLVPYYIVKQSTINVNVSGCAVNVNYHNYLVVPYCPTRTPYVVLIDYYSQ